MYPMAPLKPLIIALALSSLSGLLCSVSAEPKVSQETLDEATSALEEARNALDAAQLRLEQAQKDGAQPPKSPTASNNSTKKGTGNSTNGLMKKEIFHTKTLLLPKTWKF